jgi:hypothetical protein
VSEAAYYLLGPQGIAACLELPRLKPSSHPAKTRISPTSGKSLPHNASLNHLHHGQIPSVETSP